MDLDYFEILRWGGAFFIFVGVTLYLFFQKKSGGFLSHVTSGSVKTLGLFTVDVTSQGREGRIDPVIGREEEIMRVTQILTRRTKNNVILVGPPGVGKTAIVEGLALKIVTGDVPLVLKNKRLLSLNVAELLAGTKYRGEFEQRVKHVVDGLRDSNRTIILFIDEIHTIMQTKGAEGAVNFSDILKPTLARGDLQLIGATTQKEYEQFIQPDESWDRRFQQILVDEPSVEESIDILKGIKHNYETYHQVQFTDAAIEAAVRLSEEYIKGRRLPDKAIDVIDEAAAMVNVHEGAAPDHAVALLHGAAKKVAATASSPIDSEELIKLKTELQKLKKIETETHNDTDLHLIRKKIVNKVREIEQAELEMKQHSGWPTVDVAHVKEVVADWVGMKVEEIH